MDGTEPVSVIQLVHEQHPHIEGPRRERRDGPPSEPFSDTVVDGEDEKDFNGAAAV